MFEVAPVSGCVPCAPGRGCVPSRRADAASKGLAAGPGRGGQVQVLDRSQHQSAAWPDGVHRPQRCTQNPNRAERLERVGPIVEGVRGDSVAPMDAIESLGASARRQRRGSAPQSECPRNVEEEDLMKVHSSNRHSHNLESDTAASPRGRWQAEPVSGCQTENTTSRPRIVSARAGEDGIGRHFERVLRRRRACRSRRLRA